MQGILFSVAFGIICCLTQQSATKIEKNSTVKTGDTIEALENGRGKIEFENKTTMYISPNSKNLALSSACVIAP
jgi:hypothetical protein